MFGDGSTLNNALFSAMASSNFTNFFAPSTPNFSLADVGAPDAYGATSIGQAQMLGGSPIAVRALGSSTKQIYEHLARRQQQKLLIQQQQRQQYQQQEEQQQRQNQQQEQYLSENYNNNNVNNNQRQRPERREEERRELNAPTVTASNLSRPSLLLSPPSAYNEMVAMTLAHPTPNIGGGFPSAIMSPDITRLAADTTAVTLRDDAQDDASAFVRPTSLLSTDAETTSRGLICSRERASTSSQRQPLENADEPLDLSVKNRQKKFARNMVGPCASSPSPSNSSVSSFDSNSNASTPSKSSLFHNYVGSRVGEVKRSASSVTHRNDGAGDFDADVAEHFRRSLSGKWPRRQLNYAHYISPSSASSSAVAGGKLNGAKSLNASTNGLSSTNSASAIAAATAKPLDAFCSISELSKADALTSAERVPIQEPSSSLHKCFAEKFENNFFARKNSLTSRYVPQKAPNLNGLAPSSKIIWRKKSNASNYSNTTSDYGSTMSNFTTPCASPYAGSVMDASATPSALVSSPHVVVSGYGAATSKKIATKNSIIIINEGQQVEDHFRKALGDTAFQQLKKREQSNYHQQQQKFSNENETQQNVADGDSATERITTSTRL